MWSCVVCQAANVVPPSSSDAPRMMLPRVLLLVRREEVARAAERAEGGGAGGTLVCGKVSQAGRQSATLKPTMMPIMATVMKESM